VPDRDPRNRFAFFGVMTPFKGIDVLLRAMERLGPGFDGHLSVHGANYSELRQPADKLAMDIFGWVEFARLINRSLYNEGVAKFGRPEFMSTATVVVLEAGRLCGLNVGDSRASRR